MKKVFFIFAMMCLFLANVSAQDSFSVKPDGVSDANGNNFIVIAVDGLQADKIKSGLVTAIKSKNLSSSLKIDEPDSNTLIVSDKIAGFTKTDKSAGSAYTFDLLYSIIFNIKDGKVKYNVPTFEMASDQQYNSHTSILSNGIRFKMIMGIKGKDDVWNSKEKKYFIYNEKDKLIEKSTKEKLETLFNSYIPIVQSISKSQDW